MFKGTIEHLAEESKGFGFIKFENQEKNVFFHAKDLEGISFRDLRKGDAVIAEDIEENHKGLAAHQVRLA